MTLAAQEPITATIKTFAVVGAGTMGNGSGFCRGKHGKAIKRVGNVLIAIHVIHNIQ
jgi:hypothetical protein